MNDSEDSLPFVSRFFKSEGQPFHFRNLLVQRNIEIPIDRPLTINIDVRSVQAPPAQGICVGVYDSKCTFEADVIKHAVWWVEEVPFSLSLEAEPGKKPGRIFVWNAYKDPISGNHPLPGIGDNGMNVEKISETKMLVYCNSGVSTPKDFRSLVFELEVIRDE